MDKITITLTDSECNTLYGIIKKIEDVKNPDEHKLKKWIHIDGYIYNTLTGAKIDKTTKRRYCNIHRKEDYGKR